MTGLDVFCQEDVMAKQLKGGKSDDRTSGGERGNHKLPPVQWFNPTPNGNDIKWLEDRGDALLEDCFELLEGIKETERLSIKFDIGSGRWLAVLFADGHAGRSNVQALSVRGANSVDALGLLAYFVRVKFADGWQTDDVAVVGRFG